jgi:hypothetical protein
MKISTISVQVAILGALVSSLHAKDPVLTTPGTASWTTEATTTGTRTVFTLSKNTVFNWEELNLKSGSEMVFNFTGGKTVVNFLGGTGTHFIDGAVTSNGIVAFFSPTASLEVNGSIIAKGVTLSTLNTNADDFSSGNGYKMSGGGKFKYLTVNGNVEALDGDVVLGGERVRIGATAKITASQDVLIGAGKEISIAGSGERKLKAEDGFGYVLHLGETKGSRIEVAAGRGVSNQGTLNTGKGRIFLEVGEGGMITNESSGVIVGDAVFNGDYDSTGVILVPDEGDAIPAAGDSTLTFPKLSRPDGTNVSSAPQTVSYSVPISASSDAGRDSVDAGRNAVDTSRNTADAGSYTSGGFRGGAGGSPVETGGNPVSVSGTVATGGSTVATVSETGAGNATPVTSGVSVTAQKSARVEAGGRPGTAPQLVTHRVPMSASAGGGRDFSYSAQAAKRAAQNAKSKSLLQRSSFFGMRGGNTSIAKR